jgi:hypothetical protein
MVKYVGKPPEQDHEFLAAADALKVDALCRTCSFWCPMLMPLTGAESDKHGTCRRMPPRMDEGWPTTEEDDWCGAWRPGPECGIEF